MANKEEILSNIQLIKQRNEELVRETSILNNIADIERRRTAEIEIRANNKLLEIEQLRLEEELRRSGLELTEEENAILEDIHDTEEDINRTLTKQSTLRKGIVNIIGEAGNQLKMGWNFLMESDKTIKSTIRNLGLSGTKADYLRGTFEDSAAFVARLGGGLQDVQTIIEGYADETGRARVFTAQMVQDITAIGRGTGLGVENATRLAAQFELMGFDARTTMEYVQGVVDTSERMGVNTTKVLKNISDNFKRLNKYNFQQGVKGFAQMAQYAEKFNIDMNEALNAADVARGLEGAVDLAAQLQIMGGEFAKTDPFELLFLSRNDPAKFTEKINEMTKGVVTFRKMADGTFEKFISPADRDRLAAVEKSLGMQSGELTKQAQRMADIQKMRSDMRGMGLSDEQKELIEGAAIFNKESGKFQVAIGGQMRDISALTKDQANAFAKEQVSLEERAKQAQTFEEVYQATLNELKSALLPLLQTVNGMLVKIRPVIEKITNWLTSGPAGWMKVIGAFTTATLLWKGANAMFNRGVERFIEGGGGGRRAAGGGVTRRAPKASGVAKVAGKGGGAGAFGKGAGMGAALAGAGAGIMMASQGISQLADSMSKLTPEQAETLKEIVNSLLIFTGIAAGLAVAITLLGTTGGAMAGPLLAFGAAVALIGAGIGIAAMGIGQMAEGLAELVVAGKGAGEDMLMLSAGIGALSLAMLGFTAGAVGLLVFSGVMKTIAKHANAIGQVGEGFKEINAVMSGNKDDYIAVADAIERIANANINAGGMFNELATLLKTPLKVEFADKNVAVVSDVTLNVDGQKLMNQTYNVNTAIQKYEALKQGKGNNA